MVRLENPSGGIVQVDPELAKELKAQGWRAPKRTKTAPEGTADDSGAPDDAATGDDTEGQDAAGDSGAPADTEK